MTAIVKAGYIELTLFINNNTGDSKVHKNKLTLIAVTILVVFGSIALYLSCGGKLGPSSSEAGTVVPMTGQLDFPEEMDIDPDKITVSFGDYESGINDSGEFNISGNGLIPGLAMAYDEDTTAVLMKIVPYPTSGADLRLTVRSTALALAYMNPFVCVGEDYEAAMEIISKLESLPELDDLEEILEQKLLLNPKILGTEDDDIAAAVAEVVVAYLDLYLEVARKYYPSLNPQKPAARQDEIGGIGIIPTTQTSGHTLSYLGNDTYQATNAYGRWAIMYIERDDTEYWLPPNGSMLDFIRDGLPWAPSSRTFNMSVSHEEDTVKIHFYGYGFSGDEDNSFANLTNAEKIRTHKAGMLTFFFEFCGHLGSVISNSVNGIRSVDGYEKFLDENLDTWWLDLMTSDATFLAQVELLYEQELYSDMAWLIAKKLTELIASNNTARNLFFRLSGRALKDAHLKKFNALVSSPAFYAIAQGFIIGNKVTSVMKTIWGFGLSQLKTTFKVWKEVGEFGDIVGYVMEKDFPFGPIEGATVELGGDGNNPLPGHVTVCQTDADGGFRFSDCLIGTKTVTASKSGYETKSVNAVVTQGNETSVTIELPKETGTVQGVIVNEIKVQYRRTYDENQDTLFTRDAIITGRATINGEEVIETWTVSSGIISRELPVANWWLKAEHDDYIPDSMQVTVAKDQITDISRPFRMMPRGSMTATVYIQEVPHYYLNFPIAASFAPGTFYSSTEFTFYGLQEGTTYHTIAVRVNMNGVKETGFYYLGSEYLLNYGNTKYPVEVGYITNYVMCDDGTDQDDMQFFNAGVPGAEKCDCGIELKDYGNIIFTEYGLELGDVIAGEIISKIAGRKSCDCVPIDNDNNGTIDDWEVTCQNVDIDVKFRLVVGSHLTRSLTGTKDIPPTVQKLFGNK